MRNMKELKKIEIFQECGTCDGTGLYSGMGESDGAAIVCHRCEGNGSTTFVHEYRDFYGRRDKAGIRRVFRGNPGIGIGESKAEGLVLEDFGGMPYENWKAGEEFPSGSEDRKHTCPAWWYQSVDYKKKPEWCSARCGLTFFGCPTFDRKEGCWDRFDADNPVGEES